MIIIPQSCPISASAQGMKALDLASPESCQTFAQSLTARGKHLRSQIWLRKWKTDRWMSHLSGRTWLHSPGDSFVESWVEECSRLVGPASPSVSPDNAKVPRMSAGCSTSSQMELWSFSPDSSLPKTWKDFCLQNSQTGAASLPIVSRDWKGWVTQLRQDYSQRVKQGRPTDESACSSWPTASARDWKDTCGMSESGENPDGTERKRLDQLARAVFHDQRTGPGKPMRGQRVQESINTTGSHPVPSEWPTPSATNPNEGESLESWEARRAEQIAKNQNGNGMGTPLGVAVRLWPTPRASENDQGTAANPMADGVSSWIAQGRGATLTTAVKQELWPTVTVNGNHNRKGLSETSGDGLSTAVKMFPTPRASDVEKGSPNQRGSKGDQMLPSAVQNWGTPRVGKGDGNAVRGFQSSRLEDQVAASWATPQTRDYRSGGMERWANKEERSRNLNDQIATTQNQQNGRLNPRWVETLMGIPIGWTMPSCSAPLAIVVLTNSACSATESCPPPPPLHS